MARCRRYGLNLSNLRLLNHATVLAIIGAPYVSTVAQGANEWAANFRCITSLRSSFLGSAPQLLAVPASSNCSYHVEVINAMASACSPGSWAPLSCMTLPRLPGHSFLSAGCMRGLETEQAVEAALMDYTTAYLGGEVVTRAVSCSFTSDLLQSGTSDCSETISLMNAAATAFASPHRDFTGCWTPVSAMPSSTPTVPPSRAPTIAPSAAPSIVASTTEQSVVGVVINANESMSSVTPDLSAVSPMVPATETTVETSVTRSNSVQTPVFVEQDRCRIISCSSDCLGTCGWSSRYQECQAGAFTRPDELGLGLCSTTVTANALPTIVQTSVSTEAVIPAVTNPPWTSNLQCVQNRRGPQLAPQLLVAVAVSDDCHEHASAINFALSSCNPEGAAALQVACVQLPRLPGYSFLDANCRTSTAIRDNLNAFLYDFGNLSSQVVETDILCSVTSDLLQIPQGNCDVLRVLNAGLGASRLTNTPPQLACAALASTFGAQSASATDPTSDVTTMPPDNEDESGSGSADDISESEESQARTESPGIRIDARFTIRFELVHTEIFTQAIQTSIVGIPGIDFEDIIDIHLRSANGGNDTDSTITMLDRSAAGLLEVFISSGGLQILYGQQVYTAVTTSPGDSGECSFLVTLAFDSVDFFRIDRFEFSLAVRVAIWRIAGINISDVCNVGLMPGSVVVNVHLRTPTAAAILQAYIDNPGFQIQYDGQVHSALSLDGSGDGADDDLDAGDYPVEIFFDCTQLWRNTSIFESGLRNSIAAIPGIDAEDLVDVEFDVSNSLARAIMHSRGSSLALENWAAAGDLSVLGSRCPAYNFTQFHQLPVSSTTTVSSTSTVTETTLTSVTITTTTFTDTTTTTTLVPTESPSSQPTHEPTQSPTVRPSGSPTLSPTFAPTDEDSGSGEGTCLGSCGGLSPDGCRCDDAPSATPTVSPTTTTPTSLPTNSPSLEPTISPTSIPTGSPSYYPSAAPTLIPTEEPTSSPTAAPTAAPTVSPTLSPTAVPTAGPTVEPTARPTAQPTSGPTAGPTAEPTAGPTVEPTTGPSDMPTLQPTLNPSIAPSSAPSPSPTFNTDAQCPAINTHASTVDIIRFAGSVFSSIGNGIQQVRDAAGQLTSEIIVPLMSRSNRRRQRRAISTPLELTKIVHRRQTSTDCRDLTVDNNSEWFIDTTTRNCAFFGGALPNGTLLCNTAGAADPGLGGITAQQACCSCGGGITSAPTTSAPTQVTCEDIPLPSGLPWHPTNGLSAWNCNFHFVNHVCDQVYPNSAMNPAQACCQCGGGSFPSTLTLSPTESPTPMPSTTMPTSSPTMLPSSSPTARPTAGPTMEPTQMPTALPSTLSESGSGSGSGSDNGNGFRSSSGTSEPPLSTTIVTQLATQTVTSTTTPRGVDTSSPEVSTSTEQPSTLNIDNITTAVPLTTVAGCTDLVGLDGAAWNISAISPNYNCDFFERENLCLGLGNFPGSNGLSASESCCICGGGINPPTTTSRTSTTSITRVSTTGSSSTSTEAAITSSSEQPATSSTHTTNRPGSATSTEMPTSAPPVTGECVDFRFDNRLWTITIPGSSNTFGCAFFADDTLRCVSPLAGSGGMPAQAACCACGGGNRSIGVTSTTATTSISTPRAATTTLTQTTARPTTTRITNAPSAESTLEADSTETTQTSTSARTSSASSVSTNAFTSSSTAAVSTEEPSTILHANISTNSQQIITDAPYTFTPNPECHDLPVTTETWNVVISSTSYDCAFFTAHASVVCSSSFAHARGSPMNLTALQACCACGGGNASVATTSVPTSSSTTSTSVEASTEEPSTIESPSASERTSLVTSAATPTRTSFTILSNCSDHLVAGQNWRYMQVQYGDSPTNIDCTFFDVHSLCGNSIADAIGYGNMRATQACCACGGGTTGFPIDIPTTSSTAAASTSPEPITISATTTANFTTPQGQNFTPVNNSLCSDRTVEGNMWHSLVGSTYNCAFFEEFGVCEMLAAYPGLGNLSPQEACCFCGGGLDNAESTTTAMTQTSLELSDDDEFNNESEDGSGSAVGSGSGLDTDDEEQFTTTISEQVTSTSSHPLISPVTRNPSTVESTLSSFPATTTMPSTVFEDDDVISSACDLVFNSDVHAALLRPAVFRECRGGLDGSNGVYISNSNIINNPEGIFPADFDGDSRIDLGVWSSQSVQFYYGMPIFPSSSVAPSISVDVSAISGIIDVVAADWDFDGRADLAILTSSAAYITSSNDIPQSVVETSPILLAGNEPFTHVLVGDSFSNLIIASAIELTIMTASPTTPLRVTGTMRLAFPPERVDRMDANGDGIADILIVGAHSAIIIFGSDDNLNPETWAVSSVTLSSRHRRQMTQVNRFSAANAGDFNGDGNDDIIFSLVSGFELVFGAAAFPPLITLGDNSTATMSIEPLTFYYPRHGPITLSGADVNADGYSDILVGADLIYPDGNLNGQLQVIYGYPCIRRLGSSTTTTMTVTSETSSTISSTTITSSTVTSVTFTSSTQTTTSTVTSVTTTTITTTSATTTTTIDPCSSITCAIHCEDDCGWDRNNNVCRFGYITSADEIRLALGNCTGSPTIAPSLPPTTFAPSTLSPTSSAPSEADPCTIIDCSVNCEDNCGWDRISSTCRTGYSTSDQERTDRLGACTGSPTGLPTAAPTSSPPTAPPTRSPTLDACNSITCALYCEDACGWERLSGRCRSTIYGAVTSDQERADRLGSCTYAPSTLAPTSVAPSFLPTSMPTSLSPSDVPSQQPTVPPSTIPSVEPTLMPSVSPSTQPTIMPSVLPSVLPSQAPTSWPTRSPTDDPCNLVTCALYCEDLCGWDRLTGLCRTGYTTSGQDRADRLGDCTSAPTSTSPTQVPSTVQPTAFPSDTPTLMPTIRPSLIPSMNPTILPTARPTSSPTDDPCNTIVCALYCEDGCGWDRNQNLCVTGAITSDQERADREGNCSEAPTQAPTQTPTQAPTLIVDDTISQAAGVSSDDGDDNVLYYIIGGCVGGFMLLLLVALVVLRRRKVYYEDEDNVMFPYAQPPSPLTFLPPPTYHSSTAAARRIEPSSAWKPPQAPPYRPPPAYPGRKISEPPICRHSSGIALPAYVPPPTYRQALFISTRQSAGAGKLLAFQEPPQFSVANVGRLAEGGNGPSVMHAVPAYEDPPSFHASFARTATVAGIVSDNQGEVFYDDPGAVAHSTPDSRSERSEPF